MVRFRDHLRAERALAVLMFVSPWLFGFSRISAAKSVLIALGVALGAYSLLHSRIPRGIHIAMDVFVGFFVIVAPYFYQYRPEISGAQALYHLGLGLSLWGLDVFTQPERHTLKIEEKLPTTLTELRVHEQFEKGFKKSA